MPSWANAARLSPAAKAEWDRAYGELDSHEDRHVSIIQTNAEGMADAAIGLTETGAQEALAAQVEIVNNANTAIDPFETVLTTSIT
jgi:predicted secreted Zn-dependent protease